MRLYHFVNETYGINNLSLKRLRISRIGQLNDPFEFLAADLLDPRHREAFFGFKKHLDETKGLICFSASWANPLLWGHYADRHCGMALGFDVPNEQTLKVNYTSTRTKVVFDQLTGRIINDADLLDKLVCTKFSDWKYEDEYRIFLNLSSERLEGGQYFLDFSPSLILREVILGMRCSLPIGRVADLLGVDSKAVKIKKAGMALRLFKVIEDRQHRSK